MTVVKELSQLKDDDPIDPQRISDIFYYSFFHSQGGIGLQSYFFEGVKFFQPEWTINDELKNHILNNVLQKVQQIAAHSAPRNRPDTSQKSSEQSRVIIHPAIENSVRVEIQDRLNDMQKKFNSKPKAIEELIPDIGFAVIYRDYKYICEQEDGRMRRNVDPNTPEGDPYLSFLCYYGLNKNTTTIPKFDDIYKRLAAYARLQQDWGYETDAKIGEVVKKYNQKHPHAKVKDFFADPAL